MKFFRVICRFVIRGAPIRKGASRAGASSEESASAFGGAAGFGEDRS